MFKSLMISASLFLLISTSAVAETQCRTFTRFGMAEYAGSHGWVVSDVLINPVELARVELLYKNASGKSLTLTEVDVYEFGEEKALMLIIDGCVAGTLRNTAKALDKMLDDLPVQKVMQRVVNNTI